MSTPATATPDAEQQAQLSPIERIINLYVAPRKTFEDVARKPSWIAALLFMMIVGYAMVFAVGSKVGWEQVSANEMQARMTPAAAERMEKMSAEQRQQQMNISVTITKVMSYAWPVMALIVMAVIAAVLMATINFAAGTQVDFKHVFAVVVWSYLISSVRSVLAIIVAFVGEADSFTFSNPVASNLGYFFTAAENPVLHAIGNYVDVISIWMLLVMSIGLAVVAKTKTGTAGKVVFGWYAIMALVAGGFAAMF